MNCQRIWGRTGPENPALFSRSKSHRVDHLIHGARRLGAASLADDLGGHAGNRDVVRHRLDDDRAGGDARAMTDLDVAEDFCAGADQDAVTDLRMAVLVLLAGTAERDTVQD